MNIQENVPLKEWTYYEIGGPARYFIEAKNKKEVKKGLKFAKDKNLPVFVLGSGTNVLISDSGFPGVVIRIQNTEYGIRDTKIIAGAGVKLSKIVETALDNNLAGLEWAAGIPGTIGGAVRGNAGAFGGSMAEVVKSAEVILPTDGSLMNGSASLTDNPDTTNQRFGYGVNSQIQKSAKFSDSNSAKFSDSSSAKFSVLDLSASEMGFAYRSSRVKKEGGVILEVVLGPLKEVGSDPEPRIRNQATGQGIKEIKEEAKKHMEYRKDHQPLGQPSCGSVFKNIEARKVAELLKSGTLRKNQKEELKSLIKEYGLGEKNNGEWEMEHGLPAGALIEACGLRGEKIGGAQISKKHTNFIVNLGDAKASDVYELIQLAKEKIKRNFGVELECEVELVNR